MTPLAHETWFVTDDVPSDWGFASSAASLALLGSALAVTLAFRLIARRRDGVDVPALASLAPYMPFALRIHLAVSLIGLLGLGVYLSPAMDLSMDLAGVVLGAVMAVVAIGMASGWHARAAAWLLVAAGPIGMLEFGVSPVVQRLDLLAVALFVAIAGPGRWSADHERGREPDPGKAETEYAVWALRVLTGVAVIVVAFVEKLAQPDLAYKFLAKYPQFDLGDSFGMSQEAFVRTAGSLEVLFGLLLISGALPQVVVLIVGVPFNATLFFFGEVELIGHLPVYGTMLMLLVYGSSPTLRPLVSSLWPRASADRLRRPSAAHS